ncbi:MAG: hypothetical protein KJ749_13635, partial [Planctomycetes bacterium]|nr:hypothetical protein [Planctomycetota bacterium]
STGVPTGWRMTLAMDHTLSEVSTYIRRSEPRASARAESHSAGTRKSAQTEVCGSYDRESDRLNMSRMSVFILLPSAFVLPLAHPNKRSMNPVS